MSRPGGCPISRKMNKIPTTTRTYLMTARINLSIFAVLIFFSDDLYKCLSAAAVSHVSDSAAVFVTRAARLHSPLFITLIPHFNSHFVMYSASTMTADNWNERNKCYHLPSQLTISGNWLNHPPEMEPRPGFSLECLIWAQVEIRVKTWETCYMTANKITHICTHNDHNK